MIPFTAAHWFMLSGALTALFGLGLLLLALRPAERPRHAEPVVRATWASPPRTGRSVPAQTRVIRRVGR